LREEEQKKGIARKWVEKSRQRGGRFYENLKIPLPQLIAKGSTG